MKILIVLLALPLVTCEFVSEEDLLKKYIGKNCFISPTIRPVRNFNDTFHATLVLAVLKFEDINDHETSYGFFVHLTFINSFVPFNQCDHFNRNSNNLFKSLYQMGS